MRTYRLLPHVIACILVLALLTAAAFLPARADARVRMTPAVALWRLLAHEASLPVRDADAEWVSRRTSRPWGDDVFLIHEVLLRGVERTGMAYVDFAQTYAHRMWDPLTDVERQRLAVGLPLDGNRWAGFLELTFRTPRAWARGRWDPDAARYALEIATDTVQLDLVALEEVTPCVDPVDDWGGRMDGEHARAIGLVEVDCGPNVANTGYARPSQIRARAELVDVD